jgi:hypothetical protein
MDPMQRRLTAASIVVALVAPWVMVLVTTVHLGLDHDHDGQRAVADQVAVAWHGHAHESATVPHEHNAAPAQWPAMQLPAGLGPALLVSAVTVAPAPQPSLCISTAKRSPPQPPTASPPTLRV